jgi:lysophospholipid acyltransferase (LPLAT)-like uncharacterized protein
VIRRGLGAIVGLLVRLWIHTLRVRLSAAPELEGRTEPWVLCFFHGQQFPLLAWQARRRTSVLVSLSRDGGWLTAILQALGFDVVRGSSSRGGARALAALVRRGREGHDLAFAVDGPRGPAGVAKPGAGFVAARIGGALVPMGAAVAWGRRFHRSWDRFALAYPLSRVAIVLGPPLDPRAAPEEVEAAVRSAEEDARKLLI